MHLFTKIYICTSFMQLIWPIYILRECQNNWALTACAYCILFGITLQLIYPITLGQRYLRDLILTGYRLL